MVLNHGLSLGLFLYGFEWPPHEPPLQHQHSNLLDPTLEQNPCRINKQKEKLTLAFILGRWSAFVFRTSYRIFFANNRVLLFSLYLRTLASLTPPVTPASRKRSMSAKLACKTHFPQIRNESFIQDRTNFSRKVVIFQLFLARKFEFLGPFLICYSTSSVEALNSTSRVFLMFKIEVSRWDFDPYKSIGSRIWRVGAVGEDGAPAGP